MSLTVYEDNAGKWTQVFDISEEWLKSCTPNWKKPRDIADWYQQLNQVKLNTFSWLKFNQKLFLIAGFENGDVAVFGNNFKLVHKFSTVNQTPIDMHSLQMEEEIFLTISYRTGQISGFFFHPEDSKNLKEIDIWEKEDLLEPYPIYALKFESNIYVVFSKTDEIIVVKTDGSSKTVDSKNFEFLITSLSIGGGFIYATLTNSDVVRK